MLVLFGVLIIIASVVLGLIVLIQNPKGGGLSGTFGGFGNQLMGVKQTTDVLEKGTWLFSGIIGLLCLTSTFFISSKTASTTIDATAPATQQTAPVNTLPTVPPANTPTPATNTPK